MPGKPQKPTKKPSTREINQQEYKKELRRLKRFLKSAQSRGYEFPENVIPETPKTITKSSVERLRKITPDKLYKKAKAQSPITGKTVSGTTARKQERSIAAQKAAYTRQKRQQYYKQRKDRKAAPDTPKEEEIPTQSDEILRNVEDMIDHWSPDPRWSAQLAELKERDKNLLSHVLHGQISSLGRETVAKNLQEANDWLPGIVMDCVQGVLYGSGSKYAKDGHAEIQNNIKRFIELCQGHHMSKDEAQDLSYQLDELAYVDDTDE